MTANSEQHARWISMTTRKTLNVIVNRPFARPQKRVLYRVYTCAANCSGQPHSLEPSPVPYWPAFTLQSLQASQFEAGAWFAARHWSTLTITVQNNGIATDMGCVSLVSYVSVCFNTISNSNRKELDKKAASRTKDSASRGEKHFFWHSPLL